MDNVYLALNTILAFGSGLAVGFYYNNLTKAGKEIKKMIGEGKFKQRHKLKVFTALTDEQRKKKEEKKAKEEAAALPHPVI